MASLERKRAIIAELERRAKTDKQHRIVTELKRRIGDTGVSEQEPSVLQKSAQVLRTPERGGRALGVFVQKASPVRKLEVAQQGPLQALGTAAKRIITQPGEQAKSTEEALYRASAASKPGYVPQEGERLGAGVGAGIGAAPLVAALAAPASALGTGALAGAAGGALGGGGASAIQQLADKGNAGIADTAINAGIGAVLGFLPGAAKNTREFLKRRVGEIAEAGLSRSGLHAQRIYQEPTKTNVFFPEKAIQRARVARELKYRQHDATGQPINLTPIKNRIERFAARNGMRVNESGGLERKFDIKESGLVSPLKKLHDTVRKNPYVTAREADQIVKDFNRVTGNKFRAGQTSKDSDRLLAKLGKRIRGDFEEQIPGLAPLRKELGQALAAEPFEPIFGRSVRTSAMPTSPRAIGIGVQSLGLITKGATEATRPLRSIAFRSALISGLLQRKLQRETTESKQ